jgi:hypothetical protein
VGLLPHACTISMLGMYAEQSSLEGEEEGPPVCRSLGTQTMYRESDAQTDPWEPDAVVPFHVTCKQVTVSNLHHCTGPEVWTISFLFWGISRVSQTQGG